MNTYTPQKKDNETRLFKKDLKFMDFHHVTFSYIETTILKGEKRTPLAIRIHCFVFPMQEAIENYNYKRKKQTPEVYVIIEKGLIEAVRRAKISLGRIKENNKLFIGYWNYLANVYHEDALLLKDTELERCIQHFKEYVQTMKP